MALNIYRRRLIPDELIHLDSDEIIEYKPPLLITRWKSIKPRKDFATGISAYYINRNFKISKFFRHDGSFSYYYCDIIKTDMDGENFTFTDLLVDVVIYPDGSYRVLDLRELREAHDIGLLTIDDVFFAIEILDNLLKTLQNGEFAQLAQVLE